MARSRISDARVWRRACDFLGLMKDPAICSSILGPTRPAQGTAQKVGSINWSEGSTKMIAHIPFYIVGEQEGEGYFASVDIYSSALHAHFFALGSKFEISYLISTSVRVVLWHTRLLRLYFSLR